MARSLLLRGMFAGLLAGLIVFGLARSIGEPQVDRAIAFESAQEQARGEAPEPEMVSRPVQRGLGLLTATLTYGTALGGIFGLVFACAQGRVRVADPRILSVAIAAAGFVSVVLVPSLKYPANPPAVGNPDTIGIRTAAYFLLIAFSLAAMGIALQLYRPLSRRLGAWNGALTAALLFLVLASVCSHLFPAIDEVPPSFPATLLWRFRIASWELQAALWTSLALSFGALTERARSSSRITSG